jgi:YrbI family 3-deoxy-D-manno-octulosonate 8-phosphate phosphatase
MHTPAAAIPLAPFTPRPRTLASLNLAQVALLVLDFDGVLTDNRVLTDQNGLEAVLASRGDGMGIGMLRAAGVHAIVISKEANPVVAARCNKLKLRCIQGIDDKLPQLKAVAAELGVTAAQCAYVGNDINDVECMGWVAYPIAVADAEPVAIAAAMAVTSRVGGHGAVREVIDRILADRNATGRTAR